MHTVEQDRTNCVRKRGTGDVPVILIWRQCLTNTTTNLTANKGKPALVCKEEKLPIYPVKSFAASKETHGVQIKGVCVKTCLSWVM